MGYYPAGKDAPTVPGLEGAGTVVDAKGKYLYIKKYIYKIIFLLYSLIGE